MKKQKIKITINPNPDALELSSRRRTTEDRTLFAEARKIINAIGVSGAKLNGVYEFTGEYSGGFPVYQKQEDVDLWLIYFLPQHQWLIQHTSDLGTNKGVLAYINCNPPELPERIKNGQQWKLDDGKSSWSVQPHMTAVIATASEIAKGKEKRNAQYMVVSGRKSRLVSGSDDDRIDGVFTSTTSKSHRMPIFSKKDLILIYNEATKKWIIQKQADKNKESALAWVYCYPPRFPEQLDGACWWVFDEASNTFFEKKTIQVIIATPEEIDLNNKKDDTLMVKPASHYCCIIF